MDESKKEEGRDDDVRPFDYTYSKKEEVGHGDEEGAGHDDDHHPLDYTDSKKEEGHDDGDDDRPFDFSLQVITQAAKDFLRGDYPEGYAGAGEERSPPLQRPHEYYSTHGVAKRPRRFPEKRSINKKRRVSPPTFSLTAASTSDVDKFVKSSSPSRGIAKLQESASTSTSTTDSDNPCWKTQLLRRWGVSKARSRRIYSNSGEGTSTDRRLQRDPAAGAERAADHQPPPPPAAPLAGRTWREVHRDQMGGGKVVRIGKKKVHRSDKSTHQGRLLLPHSLETQVYKHAIRREKETINAAGLQVEVLDYYGERFVMTCKYRKCHRGMVFNGGWTRFLREHEERHLREGESLLLLAFRSQQQRLCFVFLPQHLQGEDQDLQGEDQDLQGERSTPT